MGEENKKYNRRISRPCPVCGGRVVVGHRTCSWWVYCEENSSHIPQRRFSHPQDAIYQWNLKANRVTNGDRVRDMGDWELAALFKDHFCPMLIGADMDCQNSCEKCWLDWLKQEVK
jgi:hypothetical protein